MKRPYFFNLFSDHVHTLPLLVLYLTDGCNSRCVTCDIWHNPRRNMSLELVDHLTGSFESLQVRSVLLSGGEAMQHPQWPEIARRIRSAGAAVMLLTNGLLLRTQASKVIENVDEVIVSLDGGTPATYKAIRGVDAFDLVTDGMKAVADAGIPVTTRTTIQSANFREMPQIITTAKAAGASHISFLTVDVSSREAFGPRFEADPSLQIASMGPGAPPDHGPAATALTSGEVAEFAAVLDEVEARFAGDFASGLIAESPAKLRRMVNYFRAINGEAAFDPPRCNAPHISTVIEVDGRLRPCYFLPTYGKLDDQPIADAINSGAAKSLRQQYRTRQRHECTACVCPLYKGPRTLLRESLRT